MLKRRPQDGPWNRDLLILESKDGRRFGKPRPFVKRAGVPCVIRTEDERLVAVFQWFPFDRAEAFDRVGVVFSNDDGKTWSAPEPIRVAELPAGAMRPFDPTLLVLPEGTLRLYFTSQMPENRQPAIYSAVSTDGVRYVFEPGVRSPGSDPVVDAAVAQFNGTWHMFAHLQSAPGSGRGYHAVSEDGVVFRRLADVQGPRGGDWIGNVLVTRDGMRYFGSGREGIWTAFSRDGASWQLESPIGVRGGDPSVVRATAGGYLMIVTGPPRSDAGPPRQRRSPKNL